jgi:hypothetical protein
MNMEWFNLDTLLNLAGLLTGGGFGIFFTWRYMKRKARAEAVQAEAEAKQKEAEAKSAEVDMAQKVQDTYQEMLEYKQKEVDDNHRLIEELRADRDHYKQGYVEMRDEVEKLSKDFYEFKRDTEDERQKMKRDIARNTRIAESSRPFMCGLAPECAKCVPVIISDDGAVTPKAKPAADETGTVADVEPLEQEVL